MKRGNKVSLMQLYDFAVKHRLQVYAYVANGKFYAQLNHGWLKSTRTGTAKIMFEANTMLNCIWVKLLSDSDDPKIKSEPPLTK